MIMEESNDEGEEPKVLWSSSGGNSGSGGGDGLFGGAKERSTMGKGASTSNLGSRGFSGSGGFNGVDGSSGTKSYCLTRFHSHRISFIFRPTFRRSSRPLASRSEQEVNYGPFFLHVRWIIKNVFDLQERDEFYGM
ncbi:unnamed protein product [Lactuca saligna]|uniref:Uncharacterized protein n=1 Tax=Lactuca saligna TaxID=75948 RepID=A0AA35ZM16_LACSI|nr:unnamed protein product [Lactuca saligna]